MTRSQEQSLRRRNSVAVELRMIVHEFTDGQPHPARIPTPNQPCTCRIVSKEIKNEGKELKRGLE
jgi:hypothetical protein